VPALSYLILVIAAGTITATQRLVPAAGPIPQWAMGLLVGGAAGAILACLFLASWRRLRNAFEAVTSARLLNAATCGLAATGIAALLAYAAGLLFPPARGTHILQGSLFSGGLLSGLALGFRLDRPLFALRQDAQPTTARRNGHGISAKVIDTSVIIDGRISDLLQTGFMEGEILVPEFVLGELQGIADSSNSLRRRKGRRGLEILRGLMDDGSIAIRIVSNDYPGVQHVDRKLIRLAKERCGALVTTDYNLNRVAQVEGVKVLNVNELANAVKPRFIPGEELDVEVIDRGEEIGQGVGYLDDGTMVVVENGRRHIGRKIRAIVKSTLQTEAGRMLFVEPSGESSRWAQ
jgi:uncharacterized protein YacL